MSINAVNYSRLNLRRRHHEIVMKRLRIRDVIQSLGGIDGAIANKEIYFELTDIINELHALRKDLREFSRNIYD